MDIEPLWALGGWFLVPNCMATPKTSSSISEIHTKLHPLIFFLALVFIFLLLVSPISNPTSTNPSSMALITSKRLLLEPSESTMSTTNLNPKKAQDSHSTSSSSSSSASTRREFGAEAHEVPSGPNPISN